MIDHCIPEDADFVSDQLVAECTWFTCLAQLPFMEKL
jgi:hypothetical protein